MGYRSTVGTSRRNLVGTTAITEINGQARINNFKNNSLFGAYTQTIREAIEMERNQSSGKPNPHNRRLLGACTDTKCENLENNKNNSPKSAPHDPITQPSKPHRVSFSDGTRDNENSGISTNFTKKRPIEGNDGSATTKEQSLESYLTNLIANIQEIVGDKLITGECHTSPETKDDTGTIASMTHKLVKMISNNIDTIKNKLKIVDKPSVKNLFEKNKTLRNIDISSIGNANLDQMLKDIINPYIKYMNMNKNHQDYNETIKELLSSVINLANLIEDKILASPEIEQRLEQAQNNRKQLEKAATKAKDDQDRPKIRQKSAAPAVPYHNEEEAEALKKFEQEYGALIKNCRSDLAKKIENSKKFQTDMFTTFKS